MADDEEAARKARAASLRQQIASLKSGGTKTVEKEDDSETGSSGSDKDAAPNAEAQPGESPREFIQRRMRELKNKT